MVVYGLQFLCLPVPSTDVFVAVLLLSGFMLCPAEYEPSQEFVSAVVDAIGGRMEHFKPYELSTVVYALVRWGVQLDNRWIVSCTNYLDKHIDEFDANAVCSIVWSLTRYRTSPWKKFEYGGQVAASTILMGFETIISVSSHTWLLCMLG